MLTGPAAFKLAAIGCLAAAVAEGGDPKPGNCGDTEQDMRPGACSREAKGSWNATAAGIHDLAGCVARCKQCSQCNYISYNPTSRDSKDPADCSWYRSCDMGSLAPVPGYTSEKVGDRPPPPPPPPVSVTVSLPRAARATRNVSTIATIEVDVMPFLGRKSNGKTGGGPHDKAFYWLSQLGADMVRFAPWFPNPKLVVAELHPPDCGRNYSSWDPRLLDGIYTDFAAAVGNHTVAMQLSTLPSWMFTDGMNISACPADPWEPCMNYGRQGGHLRDKTCGEVARYIARLVGWFTAGGARDECGNWHASGHHYEWAVLSVLNEVQHEHFGPDNMGKNGPAYGVAAAEVYTTCFDAIAAESRKVYPTLQVRASSAATSCGPGPPTAVEITAVCSQLPNTCCSLSGRSSGRRSGPPSRARSSSGTSWMARTTPTRSRCVSSVCLSWPDCRQLSWLGHSAPS